MISYLYWFLVAALIFVVLFSLGARLGKWKPAAIIAVILVVLSTLLYYFYLEQMFVKRWGGTMSIRVPAGQLHMGATWKGDHLWIQNYDPQENVCIFSEYARGNVLEGRVILRDCNPLLPAPGGQPATPRPPTGSGL